MAFVVGKAVGLVNGSASADYIHLYHGNASLLAESLQVIQQTARRDSRGIETADASGGCRSRHFRWDGRTMHVWHVPSGSRFQALSMVRGHIYTDENGVGLEEIVGDNLRPLPGGDAYANSKKLFLHPYDDGRILISQRDRLLSLYDGQKVTPFPTTADSYLKVHKPYTSTQLQDGSLCVTTLDGGAVLAHDGKLRQIIDVADGLLDPGALNAFQDRDGALWIGTAAGVSRVEIASPISIFSRNGPLDAIRFQGSIYVADGGGTSPALKLISDPLTNRPSMVPLHGANRGFSLLKFKDHSGKTPDQLLLSTSEGVMRVADDKLIPTLPSIHTLDNQTYVAIQSRKNPARVFIGHGDGVASMRWDGSKWIDEGRLPNTVYVAHTLAEDSDGDLWVGGGKGHLLRVKVASTGMHDSTVEAVSTTYGIPAGLGGVSFALGDLYAGDVQRSKHLSLGSRGPQVRSGQPPPTASQCHERVSTALRGSRRERMDCHDVLRRAPYRTRYPQSRWKLPSR